MDSYALISDADAQHGDGSCASRNSVDPGAKVGRTSDCERARRRRGRMKEKIRTRYWAPLEGRHEPGAWEVLDAGYREGQRAYHTWAHIVDLLGKLDELSHLAIRGDIVATAIFWHDVVYLTRNADGSLRPDRENVCDSAELFRRYTLLAKPDADAVHDMIMATADHLRAEAETQHYVGFSDDLALFLDMDLSSLGSPWAEFVDNLANIPIRVLMDVRAALSVDPCSCSRELRREGATLSQARPARNGKPPRSPI